MKLFIIFLFFNICTQVFAEQDPTIDFITNEVAEISSLNPFATDYKAQVISKYLECESAAFMHYVNCSSVYMDVIEVPQREHYIASQQCKNAVRTSLINYLRLAATPEERAAYSEQNIFGREGSGFIDILLARESLSLTQRIETVLNNKCEDQVKLKENSSNSFEVIELRQSISRGQKENTGSSRLD